VYDTTLRTARRETNNFFGGRKKAHRPAVFDEAHFHYIEGGWPRFNPKRCALFEMAKAVKFLKNSRLTRSAVHRRPHTKPESCSNLKGLVKAGTPAAAYWSENRGDLHVNRNS